MQDIITFTISLTGLVSLFAFSGILRWKVKKNMFLYYTNLSNLLVSIYFMLLFLYRTFNISFLSFTENPVVSFSVTMIITMTFLIFHFVLVPYGLKNSEILVEMDIKLSECIIFHYIIPISAILYWFFYSDKTIAYPVMSLLWLGAPLLYFIFIMLRARNGNIEGTKSRYPYPFLDIERIGKRRFAENVFMIFAVFVALSEIIYYFT